MKEALLKLLWLDDQRLIHKPRLIGIMLIWLSVILVFVVIIGIVIINQMLADFRPVLNDLIVNALNDPSLNPESKYLKACLGIISNTPDWMWAIFICTCVLAFTTALATLAHGISYVRYSQLMKKLNPNQELEPTSLDAD